MPSFKLRQFTAAAFTTSAQDWKAKGNPWSPKVSSRKQFLFPLWAERKHRHSVCFQSLVLIQALGISNKAFPNVSPKQWVLISYPTILACQLGSRQVWSLPLRQGWVGWRKRGLDFPVVIHQWCNFLPQILLGSLIRCFKVCHESHLSLTGFAPL